MLDLETVYTFEPIPAELSAEQAEHVLGAQGQLWGERIPDQNRREYMAWPRGCALVEIVWSPRHDRNFERFLIRLDHHLKRLAAAHINYRPLR